MVLSRYRYHFWLASPIVHHCDTPVSYRPSKATNLPIVPDRSLPLLIVLEVTLGNGEGRRPKTVTVTGQNHNFYSKFLFN
jgi:hypothetical protein